MNNSILFRQKLIGATTNKNWVQATSRENRGSFKSLLSPQLATTTMCLWTIWFVAGYGFYGLMFLLPEFLREQMSLTAEHFGVLVSSAGACGGVICGAMLSETLGRRPTFVLGFIFAGIFIMLINIEVREGEGWRGYLGSHVPPLGLPWPFLASSLMLPPLGPLPSPRSPSLPPGQVDAVWLVVFAMVARFFTGVYEAVWYTYTPEVSHSLIIAHMSIYGSNLYLTSCLLPPLLCCGGLSHQCTIPRVWYVLLLGQGGGFTRPLGQYVYR